MESSASSGCPFCEVETERVFCERRLVRGLWDGFPVSPGHALLVPRRHVATWFDATPEERHELAAAIGSAREAILLRHRPDGFNIGMNLGAAAGQTVPHLHVHVIPRYAGDVEDPRGGVRWVVPCKAAGRCFYCDARLAQAFEIDHFVPWSRHPDNGLENLVAADRGCNAAKSDHLAAADHVEHWLERVSHHKSDLGDIAERRRWERHPDRSVSAARSIYLRLPTEALLWDRSRTFVPVERSRLVGCSPGEGDARAA